MAKLKSEFAENSEQCRQLMKGNKTGGKSIEQLDRSGKEMETHLTQIGVQREQLVERNPQLAFSAELTDLHSDWIRFQQLVQTAFIEYQPKLQICCYND